MRKIRQRQISCLTRCFPFVVSSIVLFFVFLFVKPNLTHTAKTLKLISVSTIPKAPRNPSPVSRQVDSDPQNSTFYDDPDLSYSIEKPMRNWDEKRKLWLEHHPSLAVGVKERILMLTGSQPSPCKNPLGDHLLVRFFKNKVDYCRIHGYDLFYNNAMLHPKMESGWNKLPLVRAAMIAHPEAEWIWWIDSDAAFTDMEFKVPLERYENHNFVVNGWAAMIYKYQSWVSVNAGIYLIRNCQWSMDFMERWARMGPQTPEYAQWSKTQRGIFKDMLSKKAGDQSSLIYLMLKQKEKWMNKIYLETEYTFNGYWDVIVRAYTNISNKHIQMEREVPNLRRRHAEKESKFYGELREQHLMKLLNGVDDQKKKERLRRPFITHFTGCSSCSGKHNPRYKEETCLKEMERALNFADDQVLRNFGYRRRHILNPHSVTMLPFDYPA